MSECSSGTGADYVYEISQVFGAGVVGLAGDVDVIRGSWDGGEGVLAAFGGFSPGGLGGGGGGGLADYGVGEAVAEEFVVGGFGGGEHG